MQQFITVGAIIAFAGAASGQVFTSQAAFDAALANSFSEDFSGNTFGGSEDFWSGNGFSISASAVASPTDGALGTQTLFNDVGILSLNSASDALVLDFGGPVQAFGGNIFASDINFAAVPGFSLTFSFSDGSSETIITSSANDFFGYANAAGITSVLIDAPDAADPFGGVTPNWPAASAVTVGTLVPAPGAMAVLGLGGLAAARRRR
ncbi:MAG: PEP-CTERM sorting domain-containing protein [Planctomycetota bacterium]